MTNGKANGHAEFTHMRPKWPEPISQEALYYGIHGQFIRLVEGQTEGDINAILLSFLVHAGNLLGRQYFLATSADQHCGNIYVVLTGQTGGGRKGTAMSVAEAFFTHGEHAPGSPDIVVHGISSGEGVIDHIRDEVIEKKQNKSGEWTEIIVAYNKPEKRVVFSLSEFQQCITNMKRPDSILSTVLRQGWDKGVLQSPSKNSKLRATGGCISIIAGSTKAELRLETTAQDAQNGTLNRFMFPCCQRSILLPEGDTLWEIMNSPEWQKLQHEYKDNIRFQPPRDDPAATAIRIRRNAEAQKAWGLNADPAPGPDSDPTSYRKLSEIRPGIWGTVTARAAQQVMRLSLILAIINGRRTITLEDLNVACEIWRYCDDSAKYIWDDLTDPTAGKILEALREHQHEGMSKHEVFLIFHGHKSKDDIERGLNWLADNGLAYSRPLKSSTRFAEIWYCTL